MAGERPVFRTSAPEKSQKSKAPWVLAVLLLLVLAGAGVFGWLWYQQNAEVDTVRANLSTANNKIAQLETTAKTQKDLNASANKPTTDTKDSTSEAIIATGLAYAKADVRNKNTEAKLEKQAGDFAQVSITTDSSNAMSKITYGEILKKVNDQWVVVWASGVGISDDAIAQYGIPKEFTGRQ